MGVGLPARADVYLAGVFGISREQSARLIKTNEIYANQKPLKPSTKIYPNDTLCIDGVEYLASDDLCVQLDRRGAQPLSFAPQPKDLVRVLYENNHLLIINKPARLSTHGAPSLSEPSLVDWLLSHQPRLSDILGKERSGIVHRLDKCTSGALIVAKDNPTHLALSKLFADKSPRRIYLALINLPLKQSRVMLERYITRNPKNRLKKIALSKDKAPQQAKFSKTLFANLYTSEQASLICAKLYTGRTHQIRAHLESLSRHILGDELYGYKGKMERVMLHAYIIGVELDGARYEQVAPLDDEFLRELDKHFKGAISEKDIFDRIKSVLGSDF